MATYSRNEAHFGSKDASNLHSEGVQGGKGEVDHHGGLGAGLDAGGGELDGKATGFNAGPESSSEGAGGHSQGSGADKGESVGDKLKNAGSELKSKMGK
ncbi:unnamed protein product [Jaminaea pallidilutea]